MISEIKNLIDKIDNLSKLKLEREDLLSKDFTFNYDIDGINKLINEYKDNVLKIENLTSLLNDRNSIITINSIESKIKDVDKQLTDIKQEKEKLIADLEKEDNICPYCKQKIDIAIALG